VQCRCVGRRTRCRDGQPLSFSASSVWVVRTRFRLQIGMIPRCEQRSGNPHAATAGRSRRRSLVRVRRSGKNTCKLAGCVAWLDARLCADHTDRVAPRVERLKGSRFRPVRVPAARRFIAVSPSLSSPPRVRRISGASTLRKAPICGVRAKPASVSTDAVGPANGAGAAAAVRSRPSTSPPAAWLHS
jgi:hypothetical protein